ncbi:MAG: hypothetical protein ACFCUU_18760, partial [Cyclobacteriaceae bacterium]
MQKNTTANQKSNGLGAKFYGTAFIMLSALLFLAVSMGIFLFLARSASKSGVGALKAIHSEQVDFYAYVEALQQSMTKANHAMLMYQTSQKEIYP